jgi:hypothetical protein
MPVNPRTVEARLKRLLSTWTAAGQDVGAVEVTLDGTIRIIAPSAVPTLPSRSEANSCDDIFGTGSE